ncbi:MAG TPA: hypothetical protein PK819_02580 [Thermomicrobiales bacterium]|nr:hypothetical protein [Thermomicrobiales bacterium]
MTRWFQTSSTLRPSKAGQDKVDAAICVLVAWNWWQKGLQASAVVGDTSTGYIVTPVSHLLLTHLIPAAAARGVPIATALAME